MLASALALSSIVSLSQAQATPPQSQSQPTSPPSVDDATQIDDVIVSGQRLRDLVNDFVGEVGAPANAGRGLAKWRGAVCVGVINFRNDVAQYIADKVSDEARALGVGAGEPGCRPNVIVVGATDGAALAQDWVQARPRAFHTGIGAMSQSRAALRRMQERDAPVRWWHVSVPINDDTNQIAIRLPGEDPDKSPIVNTTRSSRLRTQVVDAMTRVVVIVDVEQLGQSNLTQLADYISFVALAQVDADGDFSSFDTVLNLFDGREQVAGLTSWDRSYLQALYDPQPGFTSLSHQAAAIAGVMERDQRDGVEAPVDMPDQ